MSIRRQANLHTKICLKKKDKKIKDLLFILEKINVSESAYRELTVFCDGLPRTYLVSSMPGRY
jgi:hypothetical protein